jgi:hypothetical protein
MKKAQSGFAHLGLIILILLVGGIVGVTGWTVLVKQRDTNNQLQGVDKSADSSQPRPEDITAAVKSYYASKFTLLDQEKNSQPKKGEMGVSLHKYSPIYKVEGFGFYSNYDGGSTLYLVRSTSDYNESEALPRRVDVEVRQKIVQIYEDFGLKRDITLGNKDDGTETDYYFGKGLVCSVPGANSAISSSSASCGLVSEYREAAAKIEPLADLLPNLGPDTVLNGLKITDSKVPGYKTATLNQGGANSFGGSSALFYRKPSGQWFYFLNTQMQLPCSSFTTEDLRNAYKGVGCFGPNTESLTVQ